MSKQEVPEAVATVMAEMSEIERSEASYDDVPARRYNTRSKVLQIRLTEDEYERIEARADEYDVSMSTIGRDLILAGMSENTEAVAGVVAALEDRGFKVVRNTKKQGSSTRSAATGKFSTVANKKGKARATG